MRKAVVSWVVAVVFLVAVLWDFTDSGRHGESLWFSAGVYAICALSFAWNGIRKRPSTPVK